MSYIIDSNLKDSVTDLFETWNEAVKRSSSQLVGVGGLTGLCLGYSVSCARQLAENGDQLPQNPLQTGAYYSKLFLSCVWKNLPSEVRLDELTIATHPKLVDKMIRDTMEMLALRSGGRVVKRLPKKLGRFYDPISRNPEGLRNQLFSLSKKIRDASQSIFIIFSDSECPLLSWHVIGIHPATQTLFDGAFELTWRRETATKVFLRACLEYISTFYHRSKYHLLQVQKTKDSPPSLTTRICDVSDCTYQIAKRNLLMGAAFAAVHIPLLGNVVNDLARRWQDERKPEIAELLSDMLNTLLLDHTSCRFQKLLFFLQCCENEIPAIEKYYAKNGGPFLSHLMFCWKEARDVLQLLQGLETLSPKATFAVKVITYRVLHELPIKIAHRSLPRDLPIATSLFEQCMKLRRQFAVFDISYPLPYRDLILLGKDEKEPMFADFLRIIVANAEGDLGDTPIYPPASALYESLKNQRFLLAKVLMKFGANPIAPFYKGETPLKLVETRLAEGGDSLPQWQEIRAMMEPWVRAEEPSSCFIL